VKPNVVAGDRLMDPRFCAPLRKVLAGMVIENRFRPVLGDLIAIVEGAGETSGALSTPATCGEALSIWQEFLGQRDLRTPEERKAWIETCALDWEVLADLLDRATRLRKARGAVLKALGSDDNVLNAALAALFVNDLLEPELLRGAWLFSLRTAPALESRWQTLAEMAIAAAHGMDRWTPAKALLEAEDGISPEDLDAHAHALGHALKSTRS